VLLRTYDNCQLCCCVLHRGAQVFEKSRGHLKTVVTTSIILYMKEVPYFGPTNFRRHCTKCSRQFARDCAPLPKRTLLMCLTANLNGEKATGR